MGQIDLPQVEPMGNKSLEQYVKYLANIVAMQRDEIQNLLEGRLSSKNIREIAGYNVGDTDFLHKSGIVGMSGADAQNPDAKRFYSGAPMDGEPTWYVTQSGKMYAMDGTFVGTITGSTITGGTIRTAAENNQRIELSDGSFKGYTDDNLLSGLVFAANKLNDIIDLFLYHRGAKLVEFYDGIDYYAIRGASSASKFELGGPSCTTYAKGDWDFSLAGSISGLTQSDINGLVSRLNSIEGRLSELESSP